MATIAATDEKPQLYHAANVPKLEPFHILRFPSLSAEHAHIFSE